MVFNPIGYVDTIRRVRRYYVRHCAKPKGRCALALAVRIVRTVEVRGRRGGALVGRGIEMVVWLRD